MSDMVGESGDGMGEGLGDEKENVVDGEWDGDEKVEIVGSGNGAQEMEAMTNPSPSFDRFTSLADVRVKRVLAIERTYSVPRQLGGIDSERMKAGDSRASPIVDAGLTSPVSPLEEGDKKLLETPQGRRQWAQSQISLRRKEYLKEVKLSVFTGTWNVGGNSPESDLSDWLFQDGMEFDLYAIGLQEVQPLSGMSAMATDASKGRCWTLHIEKTLETQGDFVCVCARQMVGILLLIFVRREHHNHVKDVMVTEAGTGFMYKGGNKGAVAMRMQVYESSLCFLSCHLAAQQDNVSRRNQDWREVLRRVVFSPSAEYSSVSSLLYASQNVRTIMEHDLVVWVGDLNYRIDMDLADLLTAIKQKDWSQMLSFDQLCITKDGDEGIFDDIREAEINFAPTYKTNKYDDGYTTGVNGNANRAPAWTDRILWKTQKLNEEESDMNDGEKSSSFQVDCNSYRRHEILGSDHRPVSATFSVVTMKLLEERRTSVLSEVHAKLVPDLRFSPEHVHIEQVRFGFNGSAAIFLKNGGRVPVDFEVDTKELPGWLAVKPEAGKIAAGDSLILEVQIPGDSETLEMYEKLLEEEIAGEEKPLVKIVPLSALLRLQVKLGPMLQLPLDSSYLWLGFQGRSLKSILEAFPSSVENIPVPILKLCSALSLVKPSAWDVAKPEEVIATFLEINQSEKELAVFRGVAIGACILEVVAAVEGRLVPTDLQNKRSPVDLVDQETFRSLLDDLPEVNRSVLSLCLDSFKAAFPKDSSAISALAIAAFEGVTVTLVCDGVVTLK